MANPPNRVYALSTSPIDRAKRPLASTGRPRTRMANATPQSMAGNQDPAAMPKSASARHFESSTLPRHSMVTERTIMPNKMASSGKYSVENTVAYQPGNAANMAAPLVISHTSLPSQTGPMVLRAVRRWISGSPVPKCAKGAISMPTPKSNPSRMKNPRNSTAMTANHNSWSPNGQLPSLELVAWALPGLNRRTTEVLPRRRRVRVVEQARRRVPAGPRLCSV